MTQNYSLDYNLLNAEFTIENSPPVVLESIFLSEDQNSKSEKNRS